MLIIEIALGIVLAVFILAFLPAIIGILIFGIFAGFILTALAGVVFAIINYPTQVGELIFMIVLFGIGVGIPSYTYNLMLSKNKRLSDIINGEPPYDSIMKLPIRIIIAFPVAILFVGAGAGLIYGGVLMFDELVKVVLS